MSLPSQWGYAVPLKPHREWVCDSNLIKILIGTAHSLYRVSIFILNLYLLEKSKDIRLLMYMIALSLYAFSCSRHCKEFDWNDGFFCLPIMLNHLAQCRSIWATSTSQAKTKVCHFIYVAFLSNYYVKSLSILEESKNLIMCVDLYYFIDRHHWEGKRRNVQMATDTSQTTNWICLPRKTNFERWGVDVWQNSSIFEGTVFILFKEFVICRDFLSGLPCCTGNV